MKKFLLSLSVAMLSVVGAWAQDFEPGGTSDAEGAAVRRITLTLSGDWLNGANADEMTTALIDFVMGYENDAFNAAKAFTEVTIKSAEGTTVTVNQSLVQQLLAGKAGEGTDYPGGYALAKNKITYLDLSDVAVTGYVGNSGSGERVAGSLFPISGSSPVKYFAMPSFDTEVPGQTYTIPSYCINGLGSLEELIIPNNTKKIAAAGFQGGSFSKFKLNVGLEFIGNSAFHVSDGRNGMGVLDIPSTVKYIGPDAFWYRVFTDIYFHSAQAPICPVGKGIIEGREHAMLYEDCYMGNNGFTDIHEGAESQTPKRGIANRNNYISNGGRWMAMIHFPASADVPDLDIASYKDITRVYNKVYGSTYYDVTNDKGKLEIAKQGHEQEYIAREKIWAEQGSYDYVGKEETTLSYAGDQTYTAAKEVDSGFEDTYRGLNYIWPSQSQFVRAFVTVANGVNWDGVTKYRPELTDDQIGYMVEDNLTVKQNGNWVTLGSYTEESAAAYNATLPGAKHENDPKTYFDEASAIEHNAGLPNAVKEGDSKGTYSPEEAYAENLKLDGAVKAGDERNPSEQYTADEAQEYNNNLPDAVQPGQDYYYSEDEIIENNSKLEGAKSVGASITTEDKVFLTWEQYTATTEWLNFYQNAQDYQKQSFIESAYNSLLQQYKNGAQDMQWQWSGWPRTPYAQTSDNVVFTADQANAYNETLSDAWNSTTVAGQYDEASANEHNNKLPDAVQENDEKGPYTAEEANQKNLALDGAIQPGAPKGDYSAEEAIAYNYTLPNAVRDGDVKDRWTKADADAWNAENLDGTVEAGQSNTNDPVLKDYLSMIAFQSTRRCVFSDNAGGGDHYDPKIPSSKAWWTICLPFNLTKAQIDKYFGVGTHLCEFNKVERKIENLAAGEKPYVKFYFTKDVYVNKNDKDVVLQAHVPYMIFPMLSDDDAAILSQGIPMSEYYKVTGNPEPTEVTSNDNVKYRFIGNYDTKLPVTLEDGTVETRDVVVPQYSYIYAKKNGATGKHPYQFWFTQNANIKWGANKCIIQSTSADRGLTDNNTFFTEDVQGAKGQTQQITLLGDDLDDAEATAVDVIIIAGNGEDSEVIYNLNGQKLNAVPQNGVYIKNGKKYIVR